MASSYRRNERRFQKQWIYYCQVNYSICDHFLLLCKESERVENAFVLSELFSKNEADKLIKALEACQNFKNASFALSDLSKATYDQAQWMEPGTDVLGLAAGNAKTCGVAEQVTYSNSSILEKY